MSAAPDGYDGCEDSRRGYDLWCTIKRAELHEHAVKQTHAALVAAMLSHYVPGHVAEHPEIDAAFSALVMTGPVRACDEVRP